PSAHIADDFAARQLHVRALLDDLVHAVTLVTQGLHELHPVRVVSLGLRLAEGDLGNVEAGLARLALHHDGVPAVLPVPHVRQRLLALPAVEDHVLGIGLVLSDLDNGGALAVLPHAVGFGAIGEAEFRPFLQNLVATRHTLHTSTTTTRRLIFPNI